MPFIKAITPNFQLWEVSETLSELLSLLPVQVELPSFKAETRMKEWAVAHLLVQRILGDFHSISHLPSGKPYIEGVQLELSISHTKGVVAVCLSDKPIGIDVEQLTERAYKISSRFMDEQEGFDDDEHSVEGAVLVWAAKEAVFKILPVQDEVDFLQHIRTKKIPFSMDGILLGKELRSDKQKGYQVSYHIYPQFVLTWAQEVTQ